MTKYLNTPLLKIYPLSPPFYAFVPFIQTICEMALMFWLEMEYEGIDIKEKEEVEKASD